MEWICPVCGKALRPDAGSYRCENRHCFDRARSGYVNLLPPSPAAKRHGDAVSEQHPDQRAVAHADPEHKRVLSTQALKIFIYTVIHGQTFLVEFDVAFIIYAARNKCNLFDKHACIR